eukprot:956370-Pelagomonas_calceolata.AAC.4
MLTLAFHGCGAPADAGMPSRQCPCWPMLFIAPLTRAAHRLAVTCLSVPCTTLAARLEREALLQQLQEHRQQRSSAGAGPTLTAAASSVRSGNAPSSVMAERIHELLSPHPSSRASGTSTSTSATQAHLGAMKRALGDGCFGGHVLCGGRDARCGTSLVQCLKSHRHPPLHCNSGSSVGCNGGSASLWCSSLLCMFA